MCTPVHVHTCAMLQEGLLQGCPRGQSWALTLTDPPRAATCLCPLGRPVPGCWQSPPRTQLRKVGKGLHGADPAHSPHALPKCRSPEHQDSPETFCPEGFPVLCRTGISQLCARHEGLPGRWFLSGQAERVPQTLVFIRKDCFVKHGTVVHSRARLSPAAVGKGLLGPGWREKERPSPCTCILSWAASPSSSPAGLGSRSQSPACPGVSLSTSFLPPMMQGALLLLTSCSELAGAWRSNTHETPAVGPRGANPGRGAILRQPRGLGPHAGWGHKAPCSTLLPSHRARGV